MKFTKMHGCANDYIYIDCLEGMPQGVLDIIPRLSDRHTGVGGDGVVLICRSDIADFKMRMFNADGSEGAMCGNAIRCVGKYLYDRKKTDRTELDIETASGVKHLSLTVINGGVGSVTVDMGAPAVKTLSGQVLGFEYAEISMGNPHCVIFTESVETMDVKTPGRRIENNTDLFPDRTNVEFVKVIDRNTVRMRVWERGSGETMACGTGACACVVAAVEKGLCDRNVKVLVNGGTLDISYSGKTVLMTGAAEFVFDGDIREDF